MRIELVTVGDELLHGRTVNTNAATIGRRLVDAGFELSAQSTVADEPVSLEAHLREVVARADVVITTGGLGSTIDDNTANVLAHIFGMTKWRTDKRALAHLEKRYRGKAWKPVLDHARVPVGATVILNAVGTAPGMILKRRGKVAVALPGPPRELLPMLEHVVEFLKSMSKAHGVLASKTHGVFVSKTLRVAAMRESVLDKRLAEVFPDEPGLSYGLAAEPYLVDVRLFARRKTEQAAQRAIAMAERAVRRCLGARIYATGTETLEETVGRLLVERKQTVALAESCTGGLVGALITNVPGSSGYLRGGLVAYSNAWKEEFLDVPAALLAKHGAVSRETALAMAVGAQRLGDADYGVAITGIAGPGGGTRAKPVGLVYIAVAGPDGAWCLEHAFPGNRETVRTLSAHAALNHLRLVLLGADAMRDATASD
ncbi:MAG: CinA family nicotinamide mononucleotide deamidase-related protein [Verrucomicrobia bacterium]|nr:CinA family nicotinamide mononucleotide deamidase-related protein [Verrucomicrobiota bacterium]